MLIDADIQDGHIHKRLLDHDASQRDRLNLALWESLQIEAALHDDEIPTDEPLSLNVEDVRKQRAMIQQLEARLAESEKAAYDIDETIQHQKQTITQLEARVKDLEEESRQWEKASLVALLRENKALKALVAQLQGEA